MVAPRQNPDQILVLRQCLEKMGGVPHDIVAEILSIMASGIAGVTGKGWRFMMMDPVRHHAVMKWIEEHSKRPMRTAQCFGLCLTYAERQDGYLKLDRSAMAAKLNVQLTDVSRFLGELAKCHALIREVEDGRYRYRINPLLATNLKEPARTKAQLSSPEIVGVSGRWPYTGPVAIEDSAA